jgi:hypothetical protein
LRAAPRRNLAFVRASDYSRFVEVLDDLTDVELFEQEERDLLVDVFRQRMAAHETDHVPMILDVTFRSKPVADKQRNKEDAGKESELMDPPTRAETFQALRLLRGLWLHSPRSCEAAGKAGAVEALLNSFIKGVPDPTEGTVAWKMARALEDWKRQVEEAERDGTLEEIKKNAKEKKPGPPFRISCPGGFDEDGKPLGEVMTFAMDVDDPEVEYGQPDEDEVRLETLEALLALLSGPDQECRRQFMKLDGVASVADFLVPWLSENGGEDEPSELVQRCIVFVGVLIRHALPGVVTRPTGMTRMKVYGWQNRRRRRCTKSSDRTRRRKFSTPPRSSIPALAQPLGRIRLARVLTYRNWSPRRLGRR